MLLRSGLILKCTAADADDYFGGSFIFIAVCNQQGAIGHIVNRPFPRRLNELQEFSGLPAIPLYEGGPMDQEHLYFIHRRPDVIEEGERVAEGIYYGGNFTQATQALAAGTISPNDLRIFTGYCGWDAGELEAEIEQGEWVVVEYGLL